MVYFSGWIESGVHRYDLDFEKPMAKSLRPPGAKPEAEQDLAAALHRCAPGGREGPRSHMSQEALSHGPEPASLCSPTQRLVGLGEKEKVALWCGFKFPSFGFGLGFQDLGICYEGPKGVLCTV